MIFTNKNNNYSYFYHYQVFKIKYHSLNTANVCILFYVGSPHSIFFNSHNTKLKYNYLMFNLSIFLQLHTNVPTTFHHGVVFVWFWLKYQNKSTTNSIKWLSLRHGIIWSLWFCHIIFTYFIEFYVINLYVNMCRKSQNKTRCNNCDKQLKH